MQTYYLQLTRQHPSSIHPAHPKNGEQCPGDLQHTLSRYHMASSWEYSGHTLCERSERKSSCGFPVSTPRIPFQRISLTSHLDRQPIPPPPLTPTERHLLKMKELKGSLLDAVDSQQQAEAFRLLKKIFDRRIAHEDLMRRLSPEMCESSFTQHAD